MEAHRLTTADEWMARVIEGQNEELLPELEPYLDTSEIFGRMLRHPLVYDIPLLSPGLANDRYLLKTKALEEAADEENWHQVIFLHERPYRTQALIDYVVGTDEWGEPLPLAGLDQWVRDLAAKVWVDSENLHQVTREWECMLSGEGLILADEEERAEFETLPDPLTIYRGDCDDGGWSWSLDLKVAKFFATRFDRNYPLVQARVNKKDVIGYLTGRNESEVLVPEGLAYDIEPVTEGEV